MVRPLLSLAAALALATVASAQESSYMDTPSYQFRHRVIIAHGYLMGLAFAVLFPLGAIILKTFRSKRLIWFHAGWQIFAYCIALAAFGLGVWFTYETDQFTGNNGHPIIGMIVIGALFFQPVGGLVAHRIFKQTQRKNWIGRIHRWVGRVFLVLGAINGGLGLQMAGNRRAPEIAYGVLAGFFFSLWAVVAVVKSISQRREARDDVEEKRREGSEGSQDSQVGLAG